MKRVVLLVIDALTGPLLLRELDSGRYPNFQKVRENGVLREQCVSIFPSITHAALASIATGQYPSRHGVVASHWYDLNREKVVYFSSSLGMVFQKGLGEFFRDFLLDLNHDYLDSPTIFQQLEREGYETACLNFPIYRGDVTHEVNLPLLLKWIPGLPANTIVKGPAQLLLGDLLKNPADLDVEAAYTGVTDWFGFRDKNTIDLILQFAEGDEFPDFTLAYFPENDDRSHSDGPEAAHKQLSDLDSMLGDLFAAYGGPSSFLEKFAIVITGDHSQSVTLANEAEEVIDLKTTLKDHQLAVAGQPWQDGDVIMACPNLRAAHLYFKSISPSLVQEVIAQLLKETRIDQVLYPATLTEDGEGYLVQAKAGRLRFWRTANGMAVDRYDNQWAWEGNLGVVDGQVQDGLITFPDYPNAFERIAGVLGSRQSGHLWLTAEIGHELVVPNIKSFVAGGSHASLHRLDSESPLLVAGAPEEVVIPAFPRIIDVLPLCRACLKAE